VLKKKPNEHERLWWVFWVPVGILFLMGLVKTISNPVASVDAREGWHLRHD